MSTLALIFDFDDTLVPDSTTKLLREHDVDADRFWKEEVRALVAEGYDPTHAYLRLLLEHTQAGGKLEGKTNEGLRDFGSTLDQDFYPGLPEMFDDLKSEVRDNFRDITIEFYIVSGGLEDVILGSRIVAEYFDAVYGCRLAADTEDGVVKYIKRAVTFSEKTRFVFEINKGIRPEDTVGKPYLVNKFVAEEGRRVPFENMVYVGDGLTDVPCFSLIERMGGRAFGVFDPGKQESAKTAFQEFVAPKRVSSLHAPRYRPDDELGSLLRAAVNTRCGDIMTRRQQAIEGY